MKEKAKEIEPSENDQVRPPQVVTPEEIIIDEGVESEGEIIEREYVWAEYYSGPLPHPQMLKDYEEILPGAGETMLAQFVKQGNHRMSLEQKVTDANIQKSLHGLYIGGLLCVITIIGNRSRQECHRHSGNCCGTYDTYRCVCFEQKK